MIMRRTPMIEIPFTFDILNLLSFFVLSIFGVYLVAKNIYLTI
jgi:hypothetical protein